MADDREILREVWDGRVPVCFTLADEEVQTVETPDSFYLLVPRQSYFPLVTDKVARYLSKWVKEEDQQEMWLEYENQPLKWHYPIGVLFDLYGADASLPWNIKVHFQDFPEDELLHCSCLKAVESHFMSVLKESDVLKHRGQVMNNMQKKDHKQLWMGLQNGTEISRDRLFRLLHAKKDKNDKFEQFWSVNKKLMEMTTEDSFKYIPFRIYQQEKPMIQKLFSPIDVMGNTLTLCDLLAFALADVYTEDFKHENRFIIQGIETPVQTPILWLSQHFSYPDNFLHICVVNKNKDAS